MYLTVIIHHEPNQSFGEPNSNLKFCGMFNVLLLLPKFFLLGCEDKDVSQILTDKDFVFLSKNIGKNWKRFARHVNIEDNEIDEIIESPVRNEDKCYKVFKELERKQELVNWSSIKKALEKIELYQLITKFSKLQHDNFQV